MRFFHFGEIIHKRLFLHHAPPDPFPDGLDAQPHQVAIVFLHPPVVKGQFEQVHPVPLVIDNIGTLKAAVEKRGKWIHETDLMRLGVVMQFAYQRGSSE